MCGVDESFDECVRCTSRQHGRIPRAPNSEEQFTVDEPVCNRRCALVTHVRGITCHGVWRIRVAYGVWLVTCGA